MNLIKRPRRLRQSRQFRTLANETHIRPEKFILPLFITEGSGVRTPNRHLEEISWTFSVDEVLKYLKQLGTLPVKTILLFGVSSKRDPQGSEALNRESPVCRAISEIREKFPELCIATDIALDPYTDHGHDGLYRNGKILNDETVEVLSEMSLLHSKMGAHIVAPSDMMDGRVLSIRNHLDSESFEDVAILAYTAKYASAFYGPFRDALGSEVLGDKKSYQMNPANRKEALRELELDLAEGADIVMVKPATLYLDIIAEFRDRSQVPVAAYHVSGECALIEAGAKAGVLDRNRAILESLSCISRAGADLIATYYAVEAARLLS